jgi:FRG domain
VVRGQFDAGWELIPGVFRPNTIMDEGPGYWMFRLGAPEYRNVCRTTFDWLCLMRHYGLPTRLLDWSENVLVALFFACDGDSEEHLSKDGALWVLNTLRLHEVTRASEQNIAICVPHFSEVALRAQMATEPDCGSFEEVVPSLDSETVLDRPVLARYIERLPTDSAAYEELSTPIAVYPYRIGGRMTGQHSVFTLHGGKLSTNRHVVPGDRELPLPKHLEALNHTLQGQRRFLCKVVVDGAAKHDLLSELDRLGINRRTLFPELEYAATYVSNQFRRELRP